MSLWLLPGLLSLLALAALTLFLATRRSVASLWPYTMLCVVCGLLWNAGEILASQAGSLPLKHAGLALLYTGSVPLPAFWWVAALRHARRHGFATHLGPAWERVPLALAAALWLTSASNPWHGLFVTPVVGARNAYGPAFYLALGVGYVELVAASGLCFALAKRHASAEVRRGSALLAAAPIVPLALNVFFVFTPFYYPTYFTGPSLALAAALAVGATLLSHDLWLLPAPLAEILRRDPVGVVLLGRRSRVYYRNPAAVRLLGEVDPDANLLKQLVERLRCETGEPLADPAALLREIFEANGEGRVFRDAANDRWLAIRGVSISRRGRAAAVALRVVDVTESRRAEQERGALERRASEAERLRGLAALAGGLAHDVNNRLAVILCNAELAHMQAPEASDLDTCLREIENAAVAVSDLTHDLIAAAGRGSARVQRVDMRQVVSAAVRAIPPAQRGSAVVRPLLPSDLPPVLGDPKQIQQGLSRLLDNALEALEGDPAWVTVRVSLESIAEPPDAGLSRPLAPGAYVVVEVSDSGHGMDATTREHALEPFFSSRGLGRGLGLAVVAGVVHGHRGGLALESQPGSGTTVRLLLPAAAAEVAAPPRSRQAPRRTGWAHGTVLVVDDDPAIRRIAHSALAHLGFDVVLAAGGREGIETFRERRPEIRVVLLDLTMPDLGGAAVLAELRRMDPEVRVVLSSGYPRPDAESDDSGEKPSAFIAKPYRLAALAQTLRQVLDEIDTG